MNERIPPTAGIVVSVAILVALAVPFLVLPAAEVAGLPTYYGAGIGGAYGVGLLAMVALVAFAGGRQRRTEPDTVAGATLVVGIGMAVLALQWALAVDVEVLQSITTAAWMATHRWAVVALAAVTPLVSGWYARAIGLL